VSIKAQAWLTVKCASVRMTNFSISKVYCSKRPPCAPKLQDVDATAWPLYRWPSGGNVPTLRSGATSAGRRHVAAVHTILQLPPNLVVDWVKVRTVGCPQSWSDEVCVSWVNKCTVLRALWAGRLSAWLQYVTLYWKLKYFVVNIYTLITRVINNIFLWKLAILSQIYS